jgi:uncharacterized protein
MAFGALFAATRTIAIVGMSSRPERPSYGVARYLQNAGYRIVLVSPAYVGQEILGETVVATLADTPLPVDIVDCFRRSDDMVQVAKAAAGMRPLPKVLWMQLGVQNDEAAGIARAAGIEVIQNQCIEIEHMALQRNH